MRVSHLCNGALIHCVSSYLFVNVEQSIKVAGPAIQQLIWHLRVRTQHCPLQLEEPDRHTQALELVQESQVGLRLPL